MENNNKKIAKNTVYLYIRLLVTVPLAFITSRICFNALGVEDYGIYGLVAGIVVMFANLRVAFASATQRFYNAIIVKKDSSQLNCALFTSLVIHICLAVLLVAVIEAFGLWYINHKMILPIERIPAALTAFQTVVASTFLIILTIPFEAMVIAREKLSYYAYIAVLEVVLKLLIVIVLLYIDTDKLILYSLLMMSSSLITSLLMIIYALCLEGVRLELKFDKPLFKDMASFASWNFLGNISYSLVNEGLNIVLNMFGGVVANAARSIVCQMRSVINQVITTPSTAIMPQATQEFVKGNLQRFNVLVCTLSKFSFSISLLIVSALVYYIPQILYLWLGEVPEYAVNFTICTFLWILVRSFHSALDIVFKSAGSIKRYQLVTICISPLTLVVGYVGLKWGMPLYGVFLMQFIIEAVLWLALVYHAKYAGLNINLYKKRVIIPTILLTACSLLVGYLIYILIPTSLWLVGVIVSLLSTALIIYFLGLNKDEQTTILNLIKQRRN